jgi:Tfp pilus assembly protein PilX
MNRCSARVRRVLRQARADEGQSLILVMMVSVLTLLLVIAATTALTAQIKPARASLDSGAALAAAESGIEDFIAQVNQNCVVVLGCTWLAQNPTRSNPATPVNVLTAHGASVAGAIAGSPSEWFQWQIMSLDNSSGKLRLKSTGQVSMGAATGKYRTKVLIADITGTPGFPDFQYYTTFETYSSDYLSTLYADRYINVTLASNDNDFSDTQITSTGPGLLHWTGASPAGVSMADQTKICEDLYQGSAASGPGRGTAGAYPGNPSYFAGSDFAWYREAGSWVPRSGAAQTVSHNDACDVAFEAGMVMNGPIYSQDAFLLDSYHSSTNTCSNNTNQNPAFNAQSVAGRTDLAYSLFQGTPTTHQSNGNYFRTYASYGESSSNGGMAATDDSSNLGCTSFPQRTTQAVALPDTTAKAKSHGPCIYTGPTRIQIKNQTAYVTSPGTPAVPGSRCYSSDPNYVNNNSATGLVHAAVPIDHSILYVQNPSGGTHPAATAGNRIFDVGTNLSAPAPTFVDNLTGAWSGTYSALTPCPLTPVDPTKRRNFDCETGTNANPGKEDVLGNIKTAVDNALRAPAGSAATFATTLENLIKSKMAPATLVTAAPTTLNTNQVRYLVSVAAGTATTATTPAPSMATVDPFLQPTNGSSTATTQPWTVKITRYSCPTAGNCTGAGASPAPTATVLVNNDQVSQTSTTVVNSSGKFPWFGTDQTDVANDVTQYATGYGDAYVEGTVKGNLSVVAEHDLVLTNAVTYNNNATSTTTDGAAYIAGHYVRIYRPLSCVSADPAGAVHPTTPGWCPNDLSGADTSPSPKWSSKYPPSQQYKASTAPSLLTSCGGYCTKNSTASIYGLFFSLGSRDATGQRVGGSFMVDNVARGDDNGILKLTGGLYQYHRGITKLQWKDNPGGSNIDRPGESLTFNYDNMRVGQAPNGGSRVPWIPTPAGKTGTRTWNVLSMSTGS